MLNPLHLAFTVLGRLLDLIVPRPQARLGPAVAWRSPSSQSAVVQSDAATGLRDGELSLLTIDLSGLEFVDSSGLHLLLDLRGTCAREKVALALVRGPRAVQRLFAVTGTDAQFTFTSPTATGGAPSP